ncbi:MAG TPA: bifunctional precorrin-2 dehydrogenase/sirohydrochlorin ferrochelatase [Candidatus Pelethocola excrementipullorum]|nr:bifunctional precorrin-2 dehydrogenase/sirohydrochlorin ferrochelatase [Candidatus Pelethocola excrementipullorum]
MKNKLGYFPLFLDIRSKRILVVGAGNIALRRIKTLLQFAEEVEVASRDICPEIETLVKLQKIKVVGGAYEERMLDGIFLVLACTDDRELNSGICTAARARGILANNCSNQKECDFFFPSVVKQEELVIGINDCSANHKKVKETRRQIEQILGGNDADYNRNQGEPSGTGTK